ncbi:MAG: efflux RND transporter periplasmic adaptor subunit [Thiolinea sp.]
MNRKHRLHKRLTGLILSLLLATGSVLQAQSAPASFDIMLLEPGQGNEESPVGGSVIPYRQVTLSAQAPGRVEYIAGEEGDMLRLGQVLVALDKNQLLARRTAALSQLRDAEVAAQNANIQLMREMESPRSNSFSKAPGGMGMPAMFDQVFSRSMADMFGYDSGANKAADFYQQQTMVQQSYNAVAQAQAQIAQIDAALRDTQSLAPFTGQIFKKHIEVGDTVQPGQPLITYSDIAFFQIQADLPIKLAATLTTGDKVQARIDTLEQPVTVRVLRIFPGADNARHTVTVKFDLPKAIKVPTGTYAEVYIPGTGQQATMLRIPASAVVMRSGLTMVFIVNEQNETDLRVVRVGERDGDHVTLLTGLQPGQRIITNPTPGLVAGVKLDL